MDEIILGSLMKQCDEYTINNHKMPALVLMERASIAVAKDLRANLLTKDTKILAVCGSGNNGGDALAVARILFLWGYDVEYFFCGNKETASKETKTQLEIANSFKLREADHVNNSKYDIIIDGIFGVGLNRNIEGNYEKYINIINSSRGKIIALDIPSGINSNTGEIMNVAIKADITYTFGLKKMGCVLSYGKEYCGKVILKDIGIVKDKNILEENLCLEDDDIKLSPISQIANKGNKGKVLVVAGSETMCGAAFFASKAALKSGIGMVKIQTTKSNQLPLFSLLPEAMISCNDDIENYRELVNWAKYIIIGPGIGLDNNAKIKVEAFLRLGKESNKIVILDGDGLNILSMYPNLKEYLGENVILTPHKMEMSRLVNKSISEINEHPIKIAKDYAKENNCICVLKDATTIITDGKDRTYINLSGNETLAIAGSGDVLTGIISGIISRQKDEDLLLKVAKAVYIHGKCGDYYKIENGNIGALASDLTNILPEVMTKLSK